MQWGWEEALDETHRRAWPGVAAGEAARGGDPAASRRARRRHGGVQGPAGRRVVRRRPVEQPARPAAWERERVEREKERRWPCA